MSAPEQFIDYDNVLNLLRAFEKPNRDVPLATYQLWHVIHHPLFLESQTPIRKVIAIKKIVKLHVNLLADLNNHFAEIIRRRFLNDIVYDGRKVMAQLEITERQMRSQQKSAIELLTKIINEEEANFRQNHLRRQRLGLGKKPYARLFGVESFVDHFTKQLLESQHHNIFILTGMGGSGKTSIAHKTLEQVLSKHHIQKVTKLFIDEGVIKPNNLIGRLGRKLLKKNEQISNLTTPEIQNRIIEHLEITPTIIFLDGVEEGIDGVLDSMRPLSEFARILITSRIAPSDKRGCYISTVPTLSFDQASELFHYELDHIHQGLETPKFSSNVFREIYAKTGSNPLAIQLIAGLSEKMQLNQIFLELVQVEDLEVTEVYQRIYARIWEFLNPEQRDILICLALFRKNQVTAETLLRLQHHPDRKKSTLTNQDFFAVIDYLRIRSLIEIEQSGDEGSQHLRYGIHNLTRSFLHSSVIAWPSAWIPPTNYQKQTATYSPIQFIQQGIENWLSYADTLDDPNRPEDEVVKDLNSIVEIIDLGLYWNKLLPRSLELLNVVWHMLQRHGYFDILEPQLKKAVDFLSHQNANLKIIYQLENRLGEIYRLVGRGNEALKLHQ
ncbi:MAG: NB-ARC domain-containing protein, partial [Chloroflexota bacterium]